MLFHFSSNNDESNAAREEIQLENLISKKLVSIQVEIFLCLACKFENTNEETLKIHIKENHSRVSGSSGFIQGNNSEASGSSGSIKENHSKLSGSPKPIQGNHFKASGSIKGNVFSASGLSGSVQGNHSKVSESSISIHGNHSKYSEQSGNIQDYLCRESPRNHALTKLQTLDGQDAEFAIEKKSFIGKEQGLDTSIESSSTKNLQEKRKRQLSNDWTSTIPTRRRTDTGPQMLSSQSLVHRNIEDMLQVIWNENEEIDGLEDDQDDIQEDDDAAQFVDDSMEMEQEDAKPLKYGDNFHCDRCTYATRQLGNLKRHIKLIHAGVKDYQCDSCQATFSEKRTLENHNRCQFQQHFTCAYLYKSALRSFSLITVCLCYFLAKEYWHKSCS